jgi:hypothetical protein
MLFLHILMHTVREFDWYACCLVFIWHEIDCFMLISCSFDTEDMCNNPCEHLSCPSVQCISIFITKFLQDTYSALENRLIMTKCRNHLCERFTSFYGHMLASACPSVHSHIQLLMMFGILNLFYSLSMKFKSDLD